MPSIFIVGFGPGIATGLATLFASRSYSIGLISRNPHPPAFPGAPKVAVANADGGSPPSLAVALDQLVLELGKPSLVVYNVSGLWMGTKELGELGWEEMAAHMQCSVVSGLVVGQWSAKHLIEAEGEKKLKSIIYTGGSLSKRVYPPYAGLGAGKAALLNLANNLNTYLKPQGIQVGTVSVCGHVTDEDAKYNKIAIAQVFAKMYDDGVEGPMEIIY